MPDFDKYASVVVNPTDYSSRQLEHWFPGKQMRIDATEFSMFILYPDEMPDPWLDTIQPLYYAYVLKGSTNLNEFFKFIEWLYSDENNYREFTGQNLDGANSMPDQAYRQWSALTYFYNSKWNPISSVAPCNYEDEMSQLTNFNLPVMELLTEKRISMDKIQANLWTQNDYNSIGNREKSYIQLILNLFIAKNEGHGAIIDNFIERQEYTEELELKIKSLINEANK